MNSVMHYVVTRGGKIGEQMSAITGCQVPEVLCQPYSTLVAGSWGCQAECRRGNMGTLGSSSLVSLKVLILLELSVWLYQQHLLHVSPSQGSKLHFPLFEFECLSLIDYLCVFLSSFLCLIFLSLA